MLNIGFDIGGTAIKSGIIDEDMRILTKLNREFPKSKNYIEAADIMEGMVRDMLHETGGSANAIESIGVAVAGGIDSDGENIIDAHNLGFHNVPMKKEIQKRFKGVSVYLANDADAAALAELYAGAFRGYKTAVLMTLGTGVGGGIILDGRLFKGGIGHGIELGHMSLIHGGEPCTCGNLGCVESYCTATWLKKEGQRVAAEGKNSMLLDMSNGDFEKIDAKMVIECAKAGDKEALAIFNIYADNLAAAIISVTSILDPEIIALGGGVSLAGDFLLEPVRKIVKEKSFFRYPYKIVPALLGNDAGIVGAATLIRN